MLVRIGCCHQATECLTNTYDPFRIDLYDFFMHGDLDALEKANGVKKSDVWFLLNGKFQIQVLSLARNQMC